MGQKWVETHFSPTSNPFRDFRENPLFSQFKGVGNCFLKRALKQSRPSINPTRLGSELHAFWNSLQEWPNSGARNLAFERLEEWFATLLPHKPTRFVVSAKHVMDELRCHGNSSPGLEGWTVAQIKLLPRRAWESLCFLLESQSFPPSHLKFRRVPLEKDPGKSVAPQPGQLRAIDVFGQIPRLLSSVRAKLLKEWASVCLAETQFASRGGILRTVARTAFLTELSHEAGRIFRNNAARVQVWAISLDFQKLFNCISVDICARVLEIMGVHADNVSQIAHDIKLSAGYWRLPCQSVSPLIRNTRGLPQGLSTSVLLAETLVSLLMRRLVSIPALDSVLYVDDVTLAVRSKTAFLTLLGEVLFFPESFSLSLSGDKSVIWGTEESQPQSIAREHGFVYARQVVALGAEWATHPKPVMSFTKEHARLAKLRDRLLRMSHLPASLSLKLQTLSVGVLSLLELVGFPDAKELSGGLRAQIRAALGNSGGAPEIVFFHPGRPCVQMEFEQPSPVVVHLEDARCQIFLGRTL